MRKIQSTCTYIITGQFTDLEKLLSHRKTAMTVTVLGGEHFLASTVNKL
jgi:hypothetical protein